MSRPSWARWVTRISLVIALVALVFAVRDIPGGPRTIAVYFRRIGWWWIAVVVLEITITSLDALAIRSFLSPEQGKVRMRSAVFSQLAGRAVNAVTPLGNLGEAVKVSVLTQHVSQSRAVATILLYNIVSFAVELAIAALAAPIAIAIIPMKWGVRTLIILTGVVSLVIAMFLITLARRGGVARAVYVLVRIRVISEARYARWRDKLAAVDDKMTHIAGARRRDRVLGVAAIVTSRLTSMTLSMMILHALGFPITLGFLAAYTVGGLIIYLLSSLVPMGVGVSESGNWALFKALHQDVASGVTLVVARRVILVVYAAIGLVLVAASETVQRARDRQTKEASLGEALTPLPIAKALPVTPPSPVSHTPVTDAAD